MYLSLQWQEWGTDESPSCMHNKLLQSDSPAIAIPAPSGLADFSLPSHLMIFGIIRTGNQLLSHSTVRHRKTRTTGAAAGLVFGRWDEGDRVSRNLIMLMHPVIMSA